MDIVRGFRRSGVTGRAGLAAAFLAVAGQAFGDIPFPDAALFEAVATPAIVPDNGVVTKPDWELKLEASEADVVNLLTPPYRIANEEEARRFLELHGGEERFGEGIFYRMAQDSPKYLEQLMNDPHDKFLIVDKGRMKVGLYNKDGKQLNEYGIACSRHYGAKAKNGDNRTPEGFFSIEGIFDSTDWLYTDDNGYTSPTKGVYGPRFMRLKTPVTRSVGLHGTNAPGSIGKRCSHGCIRLNNKHISELAKICKKGMVVIVVPGKKDVEVNSKEGRKSEWVASTPDAVSPIPN